MSGVAMTASKSSQPPLICQPSPRRRRNLRPSSRPLSVLALRDDKHRLHLPRPCARRRFTHKLIGLRGSTPSHMVNSTVSSNSRRRSLSPSPRRLRGVLSPGFDFSSAARYFFHAFSISYPPSSNEAVQPSLPLKKLRFNFKIQISILTLSLIPCYAPCLRWS